MTNKYISHEITGMMFENNKDFYEDVVSKKFDIKLFEHSFKKRKCCPKQVVSFLAFGRIIEDYVDVIELLGKLCPNWRSQFFWFVFLQHIKNF